MNNNNRNNNRRRGRNNRGPGGGSQGNRIDSRARGNAPQMLEKYKKLAHDASLNGDRVQTEYYLQFADHYFRVIADARPQKDEQRPRRDEREPDDFSDDESGFEDTSNRRDYRDSDEDADNRRGSEGEETSQEDEENPFVRDSRPPRNNRDRNPRGNRANGTEERDAPSGGLDPASLPPAIGAENDAIEEEEARPRRRARKPRPAGDDEALEAVG